MKAKNILIFFAFLVPALIVALAVRGHYARQRYFTDGDILMANWAAQRFEPIDHSAHFVQLIAAIPIRNGTMLDDGMTSALRQAAYNFFMAYHDGSFESYRNFHMSTGSGHYVPDNLKFRLSDIEAAGVSPKTTNLQDGDEIFRDYWQKVGAKRYSGFFEGLCLNESELFVSCTNSSSWFEHFFGIPNFMELGRRWRLNALSTPAFVSDPQPDSITRQFGKIFTATLKCVVKTSDKKAFPVFSFWYYSPDDKAWIVYAVASDYTGSERGKGLLVF